VPLGVSRYTGRVKFSFGGSAVRGTAIGVLLGLLNYAWGFGHGEAIVDAVLSSVVLTLLLFAQGRTRPLLRRLANRDAKPS
jgi:hypothetical protein